MNDPLVMGGLHALSELLDEPSSRIGRQNRVAKRLRERTATNEFESKERVTLGFTDLVNLDNIWMPDASDCLRLVQESVAIGSLPFRIARIRNQDHLQRHVPI